MREVPAGHGAIVIGLLPLATAVFAAWFGSERPSPAFWLSAVAGSALVIAFALWQGAGGLQHADWYLFAAVVLGALGYAEGGKLSRELGGLETISWALVVSLPVLVPVVAWLAVAQAPAIGAASPRAWLGMAYVSVFSMFIGFLFWYAGLRKRRRGPRRPDTIAPAVPHAGGRRRDPGRAPRRPHPRLCRGGDCRGGPWPPRRRAQHRTRHATGRHRGRRGAPIFPGRLH